MQIVADFHLHSRYSRAVSPKMDLSLMSSEAKKKGIGLLTTSDWTHTLWFREIRELLKEISEGIYQLSESDPTRFLLSTEISCIYKQGEKVRRVHNLVFVPNFEVADRVNKALVQRGANLNADGRPIIGMSSRNLLELILEVDERAMLIPCHVWTPHFGVYGSASGFDSLDEAFGDLAPYIYGIETGLSSDPEMNWQIPELRLRSIMSFSDAHSAPRMGREATVFELDTLSYEHVRKAIMAPSQPSVFSSQLSDTSQSVVSQSLTDIPKTGKPKSENRNLKPDNRILYTIEFYPEEGKYHYSGHRGCKISYGPEEIRERGTTCPVCGRKMTEGVMFRVQELSKAGSFTKAVTEVDDLGVAWIRDLEELRPPFVRLVPLLEVVAESMQMTIGSKKVQQHYEDMLTQGSELTLLLETPLLDLRNYGGEAFAYSMEKMRRGALTIIPGYDGEYGKVRIPQTAPETDQLTLL